MSDKPASPNRLIKITLDEKTLVRRKPEIEHERQVAIYDLIEDNQFSLKSGPAGPFGLTIGLGESHLILSIQAEDDSPLDRIDLPLAPFRHVIKDYFTVCETYYAAIKTETPTRIEAIDVGRRALHNEGSKLLHDRLADKIETDMPTARRLFTLLCVLHLRG